MAVYPSSQPSKRPKTTQTIALPVSFTLFLYAGLAGLLLIFLICMVRVFVRHYYLCNFKLYNNGVDSRIEIIREADIVCHEADIHLATVVSSSDSFDSHIINFKSIPTGGETVVSSTTCDHTDSSNSFENDESQPAIALPVDDDGFVSNAVDISSVVASAMTVMESVPEPTDHGITVRRARRIQESDNARHRQHTEEIIVNFIVNNNRRHQQNQQNHSTRNIGDNNRISVTNGSIMNNNPR